ncbi:hypothetical protein MTR67_025463 [Solanum verrucosum]|uniref:Uncharacterized protein n=1 Tax=Solanum verrucosum TaxID=315347 RepID=A0AAF0TZE0_SOLVR|nr:hypothetical protein MTR67_025463 [Solanum verrucosum]
MISSNLHQINAPQQNSDYNSIELPGALRSSVKKKKSSYRVIYSVRDWITPRIGCWMCGVKIEKDRAQVKKMYL